MTGYKAFSSIKSTHTGPIVGNVKAGDVRPATGLDEPRRAYVGWVEDALSAGIKLNKVSTQKKAGEWGITRQIEVKELTELAIVNLARGLAHEPHRDQKQRYDNIVNLYKNQVNLSHRTSQSVMLQQYSTPAPLGYLMGLFCRLDQPNVWAFEPSAGNGLLTIAGRPDHCVVNEIDELRRANLHSQGYHAVTGADATKNFASGKWASIYEHFRADAVLTNPPFGRLDEPKQVGPAVIKDLDHWMAINAIDGQLKDDGRAAIIVGGHTEYEDNGSIRAGKNRYFLNYLYHHYNVVDTINIDGDLYKRQGTGMDVRLILINGRKAIHAGMSRPYDAGRDAVLNDFESLYDRVAPYLALPTGGAVVVAPRWYGFKQHNTRVPQNYSYHMVWGEFGDMVKLSPGWEPVTKAQYKELRGRVAEGWVTEPVHDLLDYYTYLLAPRETDGQVLWKAGQLVIYKGSFWILVGYVPGLKQISAAELHIMPLLDFVWQLENGKPTTVYADKAVKRLNPKDAANAMRAALGSAAPHRVPPAAPVLDAAGRLKMKLKLRAKALLLSSELFGLPTGEIVDTYGIDELPAEALAGLGETGLSDEQNEAIFHSVVGTIIRLYQAGTGHEGAGWLYADNTQPVNFMTGKPYKAVNAELVRLHINQHKFRSHKFIEDWQLSEDERNVLAETNAPAVKVMYKVGRAMTQVNAYAIDIIPSFNHILQPHTKFRDTIIPIETVEAIVAGFPEPAPRITNTKKAGSKVMGFYESRSDSITMHLPGEFLSYAHYYSTLFHEQIHATGHRSRLNRSTLAHYGRSKYEKGIEEFVAEFGAAFMCAHAGLFYITRNKTAHYITRMKKAYKVGTSEDIISSFGAAQKAADFILGQLQPDQIYLKRMANQTNRQNLKLKLKLRAKALLVQSLDGIGSTDSGYFSLPVWLMDAGFAYVKIDAHGRKNLWRYEDDVQAFTITRRKDGTLVVGYAMGPLNRAGKRKRGGTIDFGTQGQMEAWLRSHIDWSVNGLGMPYAPASGGTTLDTDTPDAMGPDVVQALLKLRARVGDVDEFVRRKLGYSTQGELYKALAAEQVDAVALAIDNVERLGQGIIIGDQTGIGKGRQAAAMIRYAVEQGQTPVFFTEKPNLFTDLYRDLVAVGSPHIKPFIVNGREDKTTIRDENGNVVYQAPLKEEQDKAIKSYKLPNGYDFVMLTYSQMNSGHRIKKSTGVVEELSDKAKFVKMVGAGSLIVLDESHNASGESQTGKVLAEIMSLVKGVVYLSATFAKRPDNMYIYAMRTAMSEASLSPEEYAAAFKRGGVALQEVVAGQLVAQGQMIRRQRNFDGIDVNYITLDETAGTFGMPDKQREHRAVGDEITRLIRRIIKFQADFVTKAVAGKDKDLKDQQGDIEIASGAKAAGMDNTPYFSKVFNIVNQMLFAIKAEAVADRAIARLKEGKKPVIAFSSTMGTFVEELYLEGSEEGADPVVNADFTKVLQRGLDGTLRVTERDGWGKSKTYDLTLDDLPAGGEDEYNDIARDIRESVSGLVISPIDQIKQRITDAGYAVAEVTGRKLEMQLTVSRLERSNNLNGLGVIGKLLPGESAATGRVVGTIKQRKKENVSEAFRRFNDNEVDVLMINQSGSTGASAHAVPTKKVSREKVRPRVMIVLQAELDINTEVQKRGRINRTGQIFKPTYDYITSGIPAEKRLMMMLKKKLKSLDANTTSNQRNSEELMRSDDFLNKYGDQVVFDYLQENRDVNEALGKLVDENTESHEGLAHKASGRVAVLPTEKQEEFYAAIVDSYDKMVRRLRERDEYDLEVDTVDLKAAPIADGKMLLVMGNGGTSSFGNSTWIEKLEVNNLRKPYKPEELGAMVDAQLEGRSPDAYRDALVAELKQFEQDRIAAYREFYKKKILDEVENYKQSKKYLKMPADQQEKAVEMYQYDAQEGYQDQFKIRIDQLTGNCATLRDLFYYYQPGKMAQMESATGTRVPVVCVGWSVDRKKKYPFDPKNVDCLLAVASSQKMMTLGVSDQMDRLTLRAIIGLSQQQDRAWSYNRDSSTYRADLMSFWQIAVKSGNSDRTTRYVVTGNLLQAYKGDLLPGKGKIITFSTIDGNQRRGIMLPDEFSPNAAKVDANGKPVAQLVDVPIHKAIDIIRALSVERMIQTGTGVTLLKSSYSTYKLIVPQAKHKDLYTDRMLLPMLLDEDGFNKVSNNMVANFADTDLADVLMVLHSNHGMSVKLTQDQARQLAGEIAPDKGVDIIAPAPPPLPPNPAVNDQPAPQPSPDQDQVRKRLMLKLKLRAKALLLLNETL